MGIFDDLTTTNIWNMLGPGSTAWNFYVLLNRYPSAYGLSDVRFDWVPVIADGYPTDFKQEGGNWVTQYKIKQGVKWSDGSEITADDIAFTANVVMEFKLPGNWQSDVPWDILAKVEALDKYTVKYSFKEQPGLARWQYGASGHPIVNKKFWEPKVAEARKAGEGITDEAQKLDAMRTKLYSYTAEGEPTAGEFVFVKWEKGAFVEVRQNPNYYFAGETLTEYKNGALVSEKPGVFKFTLGNPTGDISLQFTRGPYVNPVIYSVYGQQDAAVLALKANKIDYTLNPSGLTPGLKGQVLGQPGIASTVNPANGFRYLGFNTRKAPQNIKEFRQAVAILIDKEFICSSILQGAALPIYTMVPEGNGFWWNPNVPQLGKGMTRQQRIEEVVKLLKGAGFTWDVEPKWNAGNRAVDPGKGLKMPNGQPVPQITLLAPSAGYDPLRATTAVWIERWLQEAGIPVKADLTGFNLIVSKVFDEQDFDMWILGWGLTIFPDYLRDFFHSTRAAKEDQNAGGYSNPSFDQLSDLLVQTTDINQAKTVAFKLQEILADELPYVTLFAVPITEVYRDNVKWPYTQVLDGIQNYFQGMNGPVSAVRID